MPPIDRMDPESYPWPKRYQFTTLDLRRSYRSYAAPNTSVNRATHSLYNSSSGDRVLVVRSYSYMGFTGAATNPVAVINGPMGSHAGLESPVWADGPQPAGQHFYVDTATPITPQFYLTNTPSSNLFNNIGTPLAVLPPNWSYVVQASASATTMVISFCWEELLMNDPALGAIGIHT